MIFSNLLGGVALVLCGALCAAAQESKCTLTPRQAPELRGLRLGMTPAQVTARYHRLVLGGADEFGQLNTTLYGDRLARADAAASAGVNNIALNFIDDRLVEFRVGYEMLPWKNIDQFVGKMSELLGLPGGWRRDGTASTLDCVGLQVRAWWSMSSADGMSPVINFKEVGAENVIAERAAKKKEKQIQAFKP